MLVGVSGGAREYRMQARARAVETTRHRILEVARARFVERDYDEVTLTEIAAEAGVSQQTLLNHFSSKEGLLVALVAEYRGEVDQLRGPVRPGDVAAAVRGLLRQYERLGDANARMQVLADRIPVVAQVIAQARTTHRAWLEGVFGAQLPADPRDRRRVLAQLYVATDVGTWRLLRRDLGHSRTETSAVMQAMLRAVLAGGPAS